MIYFLDIKILHNKDINYVCVFSVTKVLNGYIQPPHALIGADTLLETSDDSVEWDA